MNNTATLEKPRETATNRELWQGVQRLMDMSLMGLVSEEEKERLLSVIRPILLDKPRRMSLPR